jgi:hypothetical protein
MFGIEENTMDFPAAWSEAAYERMLRKLMNRFEDDICRAAAAERWMEVRRFPGPAPADASELTALCLKYVDMRAIDFLRKERRMRSVPLTGDISDRRGDAAQAQRQHRALETCLALLPRRHRLLLDQAYFDGLSDCEVARRRLTGRDRPEIERDEAERRPADAIPRKELDAARKRVGRERKAALESLRRLMEAELAHEDSSAA